MVGPSLIALVYVVIVVDLNLPMEMESIDREMLMFRFSFCAFSAVVGGACVLLSTHNLMAVYCPQMTERGQKSLRGDTWNTSLAREAPPLPLSTLTTHNTQTPPNKKATPRRAKDAQTNSIAAKL
jgi:hypothetical protein